MDNKKFYVYGHYTKDTNKLFYIGKGCGRRAWVDYYYGRNTDWHKVVKTSNGFTVKILNSNLTEAEAYNFELQIIEEELSRGVELVNILPGGKGGTTTGAKGMWNNPKFREAHSRGIKQTVAKKWKGLVSPDGTEYRDIVSLNDFAKQHNLAVELTYSATGRKIKVAPSTLYEVASGKKFSYKGWRAIDTSTIKKYIPKDTACSFINQSGEIHHSTSIAKFAREHQLNVGSVYKVHTGKLKRTGRKNGWWMKYEHK